jgi:hypothetical protein
MTAHSEHTSLILLDTETADKRHYAPSQGGTVSDEHDSDGMTLEEFLRKVVSATAPEPEPESPSLRAAHAAIHEAIEVEYHKLVDEALATDAVRSQPDLTLRTAGRGWALHYLAARLAHLLNKHTAGADAVEFAAQKLEHDAACTRWAARIGDVVGRSDAVDHALEHLKDD